MARAFRVEENARDEESGEDEEKIDAPPTCLNERPQAALETIYGIKPEVEVADHDDEDREPAHSIECGDVTLYLGILLRRHH